MCIHSLSGSCSDSSCGCDKPKVNKNKYYSSPFTKAKKYVRVTEKGLEHSDNGFAEFMRNNKAEIVELINLAHNAEKTIEIIKEIK